MPRRAAAGPRQTLNLMEFATTLTRPPAGPVWLARLLAVPAALWARLAFAAMSLTAAVGFFVFPTYPVYDSLYDLLWGREHE